MKPATSLCVSSVETSTERRMITMPASARRTTAATKALPWSRVTTTFLSEHPAGLQAGPVHGGPCPAGAVQLRAVGPYIPFRYSRITSASAKLGFDKGRSQEDSSGDRPPQA